MKKRDERTHRQVQVDAHRFDTDFSLTNLDSRRRTKSGVVDLPRFSTVDSPLNRSGLSLRRFVFESVRSPTSSLERSGVALHLETHRLLRKAQSAISAGIERKSMSNAPGTQIHAIDL